MSTSDYPLEGVRCVELSERGSAAYAGKLLRRLGADLIKVEPVDGDPLRRRASRVHTVDGRMTTPAFDYFNEGKETRVAERPDELGALVRGADAFVLDVHPTRFSAWGLEKGSFESLGARVVCAITPFGLSGPYSDYHGSELVTAAFGGMNIGIGEPGRPPLKPPLMQTAVQGALVAVISVLGALLDDDAGDSTIIDISETDVWGSVHTGTTVVAYLFSNRIRRRAGRRVLGQPYPHQLFRCKDGWVSIQASERHQYQAFIEMVGSPEWAAARRFGSRMEMNEKHADEIDALLEPWFMERTRAEIFAECRQRKIAAAPVRGVREARGDADLAARGAFETFTGATGVEVTVPSPPFRFLEARLRPSGSVPGLGGSHDA